MILVLDSKDATCREDQVFPANDRLEAHSNGDRATRNGPLRVRRAPAACEVSDWSNTARARNHLVRLFFVVIDNVAGLFARYRGTSFATTVPPTETSSTSRCARVFQRLFHVN